MVPPARGSRLAVNDEPTELSCLQGPMPLSQLTTPYTLLDIVESVYHHVSNSALITMATEMIGQPLATLFEAILNR